MLLRRLKLKRLRAGRNLDLVSLLGDSLSPIELFFAFQLRYIIEKGKVYLAKVSVVRRHVAPKILAKTAYINLVYISNSPLFFL